MILAGRFALVTGAAKGIGQAVALTLATEGADVAVNYSRSKAEAEEVRTLIKSMGRKAVVVKAVVFLASDRARYITGEILDVNGGILMD